MDEKVHVTNEGAVRYRLRTLPWATTALAVLAAVGGSFCRSASPAGQARLLLTRGLILVTASLMPLYHYRDRRGLLRARSARFIVHAAPKTAITRRF